jgi:hypothetical protein
VFCPSGRAVEDTLSSDADPDQQLVVYTAEPGSPYHQALPRIVDELCQLAGESRSEV